MPEIAEVKKGSLWLQRHMGGNRRLNNIKYCSTGRYADTPPKNAEDVADLLPITNLEVYSRGKKIIVRPSRESPRGEPPTSRGVYMIIGFGMEGKFSLESSPHTAYIFHVEVDDGVGEPDFYDIHFNDHRHMAHLHLFTTLEEFEEGLKKYAPGADPLNEDITVEEWTRLIRNSRRKKTKIVAFLFDQQSIGGLGNYLIAEILFACRLRPDRQLDSLTDDDIQRLKEETDRLVRLAFESRSRLVYTKAETGPGKGFRCYVYRCKVYRRKKKDGTIVDHEEIATQYYGKRRTYWCPSLQV